MKHKLVLQYPSSWWHDMWREGLPVGNILITQKTERDLSILNGDWIWRKRWHTSNGQTTEYRCAGRSLFPGQRI